MRTYFTRLHVENEYQFYFFYFIILLLFAYALCRIILLYRVCSEQEPISAASSPLFFHSSSPLARHRDIVHAGEFERDMLTFQFVRHWLEINGSVSVAETYTVHLLAECYRIRAHPY